MEETSAQARTRRVAELHDTLTEAQARVYGVHSSRSWAALDYQDWDAYAAGEVLPRLLREPAHSLLRPAWDAYRQRHVGSNLDQAVHGLLDRAGRLLLSKPPAALTRWDKTEPVGRGMRRSVVTEADVAVEQLVVAGLRELLGPAVGVYAEEEHTALSALERPVCVVLDPVDQTRALLAGRLEYSVNLAIINHGRVSGWTDFPALGWRFHATSEALWFNGRILHPVPPWPDKLTVATDPGCVGLLPARLGDGREVLSHACGGVAYRLALLALGKVQAVWLPPTPEPRFGLWDVLSMAAGLQHVGVAAHGWRGDQDLAQQRPAVWAGGLLAATPETRELLRGVLPDRVVVQDRAGAGAPSAARPRPTDPR